MMHEYYEIPLPLLFCMADVEFLDLCASYLPLALAEDERLAVDRQARQYARWYLGFDPGGDIDSCWWW